MNKALKGNLKRKDTNEPLGMSGVEDERLSISEIGEILHDKMILEPVRKDGTIASISHKLVRKLSDGRIQVVHDHKLHRSSLLSLSRIIENAISAHRIVSGAEAVAVNVTKLFQLLCELRRQQSMMFSGNIA